MNYSLLSITGHDAKKFLQGQLTCDVEKVADGQYQLGAHCNPQGRIISLFYLILKNDVYYLLLPKTLLPVAESALKKYAIFFKLQLCEVDLIPPELSMIIHECLQHRIENFIPNIYPETSGKFLPHELNLPQMGAVDFDKGCYTGQEIIARMHYKGKIKNKLYVLHLTQDVNLIYGEDVYSSANQICGTIVDKLNSHLLLVLNEKYLNESYFLKNKTPLPIQKRVSNE